MNVTLRRSVAAAAVAVLVPVLSSCGSNFNAPTDQVYNATQGVGDRSGQVDVLHALIVSGDDGAGTNVAALVNNDQATADTLTGIAGAGADRGITVDNAGSATEIPAASLVQLANDGNYTVTATQIQPGRFIELVFSFENAESIDLKVPVVDADSLGGDFTDVPLPSASPS